MHCLILAVAPTMFLAAFGAAQAPAPDPLAQCNAKTLKVAVKCLSSALTDQERVGLETGPSGGMVRGQINQRIRRGMKLNDPKSPLSRWFLRRGIETATFRTGIVIDEYLANRRGSKLSLKAIAAIEPSQSAAPELYEDDPSDSGTPISNEECARRTKVPVADIGECWLNGEKLMMTKRESEKIGGGPNER